MPAAGVAPATAIRRGASAALKPACVAVDARVMPLQDGATPVVRDQQALRARRTGALTRATMGAAGVVLLVAEPSLLPTPALGIVGFAMIALSAALQLALPGLSWFDVEESLSATSAVLIIGLGGERVTVLTILWLVAVASGVLARGGRQHWLGRAILIAALALPVARYGHLSGEYAALCAATFGLLLTSGRLTFELNELLGQARREADSAETLLLAGDIASRVTGREERAKADTDGAHTPSQQALEARDALLALIEGEGLAMAAQPIVDVRSGSVHAYEALARFEHPGMQGSPLRWFSVAEELGQRAALERACLRAALELFAARPEGTSVSVNLSAPVLLDPLTQAMLEQAAGEQADGLSGLIVEITEETLAQGDMDLLATFAPLRARGASLAVDDMGAGYSGLRQITSVLPRYLKLDRSLVSGIDADDERAALVGALAGYSRQVNCLLVAEGVETEAELEVVRNLGAPLVQGYLLARPAPPWPHVGALPPPADERPARQQEVASSASRSARPLRPVA
jgi:EAL domain-containing protein (putative c-di-GMP-specific phosphodiesterase class I)